MPFAPRGSSDSAVATACAIAGDVASVADGQGDIDGVVGGGVRPCSPHRHCCCYLGMISTCPPSCELVTATGRSGACFVPLLTLPSSAYWQRTCHGRLASSSFAIATAADAAEDGSTENASLL